MVATGIASKRRVRMPRCAILAAVAALRLLVLSTHARADEVGAAGDAPPAAGTPGQPRATAGKLAPPATLWKPAPPASPSMTPVPSVAPAPEPRAPSATTPVVPAGGPERSSAATAPPPALADETPTVHRYRAVPLGAGGALLGTSYGLKLLGGLLLVAASVDGGCRSCAWREAGGLLVPIAGPLLVARTEDPHGRSSTGWAVAVSWSVADAAALTLMTIGLIGHDVPVEPTRRTRPSVTIFPTVSRELSALSLRVTW